MALPTKTQISDAVEAKGNILDPKLSGYTTIDGIFGAEMYCGGFCMVYPLVNTQNKKYAFRVWHQEINGIKERLMKISAYLHLHPNPYFVDFDYVENALQVPDAYDACQQIDALRMEWVSGKNLIDYLNEIIISAKDDAQKKSEVSSLAEKFKDMVISLHNSHISHGDLQHGNIMVTVDGALKLVDYDSVYVPTFTNEKQITSGLVGYQHPCRKNNNQIATEKDDYFSEYIIYAALLAYAEDLSLWEELGDEENPRDEYSLLFKESDLLNPQQSEIFEKINGLNNSTLSELIDIIRNTLSKPDCNQLEPLETLQPSKKYLEQPDGVIIDDDFIKQLGKSRNAKRPTYKRPTIEPDFDEVEARKRYAQN